MGVSVRTTAGIALAGRDDGPGRAIAAADNISLNDALRRRTIVGGSDIKSIRIFQPTRVVLAGDAIHAQGAGRKIVTLRSEGVERDRSIFMKLAHTVPLLFPLLRRGHGIEVRIL
jgi:hypothetical protein